MVIWSEALESMTKGLKNSTFKTFRWGEYLLVYEKHVIPSNFSRHDRSLFNFLISSLFNSLPHLTLLSRGFHQCWQDYLEDLSPSLLLSFHFLFKKHLEAFLGISNMTLWYVSAFSSKYTTKSPCHLILYLIPSRACS